MTATRTQKNLAEKIGVSPGELLTMGWLEVLARYRDKLAVAARDTEPQLPTAWWDESSPTVASWSRTSALTTSAKTGGEMLPGRMRR